jgi:haloacetate dehalogenase
VFEGFRLERVKVRDVTLRVRHGGAGPPIVLLHGHPRTWYQTPGPDAMGAGNHADLRAALRDPAVVHGMCEDYRAGLGIDRDNEEADRRAGRRITCPMMLLESAHDDLDIHGNPARIWSAWVAGSVRHRLIDSGHHQAEEAPAAVARELLEFLAPAAG